MVGGRALAGGARVDLQHCRQIAVVDQLLQRQGLLESDFELTLRRVHLDRELTELRRELLHHRRLGHPLVVQVLALLGFDPRGLCTESVKVSLGLLDRCKSTVQRLQPVGGPRHSLVPPLSVLGQELAQRSAEPLQRVRVLLVLRSLSGALADCDRQHGVPVHNQPTVS